MEISTDQQPLLISQTRKTVKKDRGKDLNEEREREGGRDRDTLIGGGREGESKSFLKGTFNQLDQLQCMNLVWILIQTHCKKKKTKKFAIQYEI